MRKLFALLVAGMTTVAGCSGGREDGGGTTAPAVFTTLAVGATSINMLVGGTQTLTATALDQNNQPVSGLTVTYASSDQSKATVTNGGVVTGVAAGTAVITATGTVGSVTKTKDVTVTVTQPVAFTTLAIAPSPVNIFVNGTQSLTATALDQNGSPVSGLSVTYVSSDPTKATVTNGGLVTGVAVGTATITATGTVGTVTKTKDVTVTVTQPAGATATVAATTGLQFQPSPVTITRGGTVTWTFATVHNVTFTTAGSPANIPDTSSGSVSRTFPTAGTFNYGCTIHPGMNGSVVVQ